MDSFVQRTTKSVKPMDDDQFTKKIAIRCQIPMIFQEKEKDWKQKEKRATIQKEPN